MTLSRRVARFVSWHRRAIAALLAALCAAAIALTASPPQPQTAEVMVAARPLAAGTRVEKADVRTAHIPTEHVPADALMAGDDVVGQTLAAGVSAGTVLQPGLLASTSQLPEGRALVPILVGDGQLRELLAPGTPISLVHTDGTTSEVLTDGRAAAVPPVRDPGGLAPAPRNSALVLVDVPAETAPVVAALGQSGALSVILR